MHNDTVTTKFGTWALALLFTLNLFAQNESFALDKTDGLFKAIQSEKYSDVKKIVTQIGINAQDENGKSGLMMAASAPLRGFLLSGRKNRKIVKYFLDKGANINLKDVDGRTAIFYHVAKVDLYKNDLKKLELLIKAKANVLESDLYGNTLLLLLSEKARPHNPNGNYHKQIAQALIKLKSPIDQKNLRNETALMMAAVNGNLEMVTLFLNHKADATVLDSQNRSLAEMVGQEHNIQKADVKNIICKLIAAGSRPGEFQSLCQ